MRAAVVQAAPALFDTPRSLQKFAELVVFPEAFVGGYPKGHDFGVRIPDGRDEFRLYFESAIEIPGPRAERIGAVARCRTGSTSSITSARSRLTVASSNWPLAPYAWLAVKVKREEPDPPCRGETRNDPDSQDAQFIGSRFDP